MIYLDDNGVTIKAKSGAKGAKGGETYELDGKKYYVAFGGSLYITKNKKSEYVVGTREGMLPLNRVVTSKVTNMNNLFNINLFNGDKDFNEDISSWDTGKVKSMGSMFFLCESFNQDISNWNVSNVKDMSGMFEGATSFNQPIGNWNVGSVEIMSGMFSDATSFNQDISNWDVSNVKDMSSMFLGATSFNQDISNWNVSNVKDMSGMFSGATSFNQPLDKWKPPQDSRKFNMFENAKSFNQKIFSGWKAGASLTGLFKGAESFNSPLDWDVSRVGSMKSLFEGATSFNQDISNWNVGSVERMSGMFSGATSFNQPIGNWDVSNVSWMDYMFKGATSFNQNLNGWNVSSLSGVENMFYGATLFNAPIGKWKVKSITNMQNMFREATAFNQDISSWDVSNVTQMKGLFQDASSFNQNIRNWKLNEKLPKSRTMFKDAEAFNIKEYNPFLNKKAKKRNIDTGIKLNPEDKKAISKIKKFLITRDYDKIDLGLELLISLNNIELFETLLDGCKIGEDYPYLTKNQFFTGSGPAQSYLDYVLFNIIANAPQEAKIDNSLLLENITSSRIIMRFVKFNLGHVFSDKNIAELDAEDIKGSLKWLKNFSKLKVLKFYAYWNDECEHYESFRHLKNLKELDIKINEKTENIDFLNKCKTIRKLSISGSQYYDDLKNLKNIDGIKNISELEELVISGLVSSINIDPINSCENLKKISLFGKQQINLKSLKNCKNLETLKLSGFDNLDLYGKISEINGLKGLKNLKNLSIVPDKYRGDYPVNFCALDNGYLMTDLNQTINKSSTIIDDEKRVSEDLVLIDGYTGNECNWQEDKNSTECYYKGSLFSGIVFVERDGILFYEVEMVNGLKDGIWKEFYTGGQLKGKIKVEKKYIKGEFMTVVGFYSEDGTNIVEEKTCLSNKLLELKEGLFYDNNKPVTGFSLLDFKAWSMGHGVKDFYSKKIKDILVSNYKIMYWGENLFQSRYGGERVSFIIELKNGEITQNLTFATNNKCANVKLLSKPEIDYDGNIIYEPVYNQSVGYLNVEALETPDNLDKPLKGKSVVVTGIFENHSRVELQKIIESNGGNPSFSVSIDTAFILAGSKIGQKKKVKAEKLNIRIISEEEFIKIFDKNSGMNSLIWVRNNEEVKRNRGVLSYLIKSKEISKVEADDIMKEFESVFPDAIYQPIDEVITGKKEYIQKVLSRPKLTTEDRKSFLEIKKLLSSRDYVKIDKGIKMLASLNILKLYETLLDGCKIEQNRYGKDKITENQFFTGSGPAQPYLDYALINIIANVPQESKIDNSLLLENITSSRIIMRFVKFNLGHVFTEKNIIQLDVSTDRYGGYQSDSGFIDGSLKWLKNFAQLKVLKFYENLYSQKLKHYESFKHLKNLEELDIRLHKKTENIDFLSNCKKIKKLNLSIIGPELHEKKKLIFKNIDALKNLSELEELIIFGLRSSVNTDALLSCDKLKKLTADKINLNSLKNCKNLETLALSGYGDIKALKNCKNLETLTLSGSGDKDVCGKILDIDGLKGLKNLKCLNIDDINISGLDNEIFIN